MAKYLLYILRWVLLAVPGALFFTRVKQVFRIEDVYLAMMISQAIMGAMVFFIDRLIFTSGRVPIPFEIKRRVVCADCGRVGTCYRATGTRCCETAATSGSAPFRCETCSVKRVQ